VYNGTIIIARLQQAEAAQRGGGLVLAGAHSRRGRHLGLG
jgi:hypothetical protein